MILLIDNYDSFTYNLYQYLCELGAEVEVVRNDKVTLVGFGTFSVSKRKARMGRNPRTGEALKIKARNIPKFSAGRELKNAVN